MYGYFNAVCEGVCVMWGLVQEVLQSGLAGHLHSGWCVCCRGSRLMHFLERLVKVARWKHLHKGRLEDSVPMSGERRWDRISARGASARAMGLAICLCTMSKL
jgi:hypothetical protein